MKRKLIRYLASQYARDDIIIDMDWLGSELGVYFEKGFGTDFGMCDWITPNSSTTRLYEIGAGSQTGLNNGLTILLDAETFDYGTPTKYYCFCFLIHIEQNILHFCRLSGFKLALVHHLDMPLMSQSGINVAPGSDVQIAVSPTIISTTDEAISRFEPDERKCYVQEEIVLNHLHSSEYRYQVL